MKYRRCAPARSFGPTGSTWSGAAPPQLQHCRLCSLPVAVAAEVPQVAAVALVSSEPVVAAVQLVVVAVVVEQALVAEALVLPLSPALVRLQTPDRRQAQPRLCSLQQYRPL